MEKEEAMFGQCPARRIGSWPPRYLWTPANPGQAGERQDFYLPSVLLLAPLRIEREGRKYVSQRALAAVTTAHMTPLV